MEKERLDDFDDKGYLYMVNGLVKAKFYIWAMNEEQAIECVRKGDFDECEIDRKPCEIEDISMIID